MQSPGKAIAFNKLGSSLEALQLAIANQLASEQKASEQLLDDLEQRLEGAEGYGALDAGQKQQL